MPITPTAKIWMDGELIDWDKATVHVLTHSLHYGMGVFEGIRAYPTANGPAIFRLRDHVKRMFRGTRILQMDMPYSEDEVFGAIKLTVAENGLDSCYIRPLAYLGYGEMGMNPIACKVRLSIAVWPWGAYLGEEAMQTGIRLKVSSGPVTTRVLCLRPPSARGSTSTPRSPSWRRRRRLRRSPHVHHERAHLRRHRGERLRGARRQALHPAAVGRGIARGHHG